MHMYIHMNIYVYVYINTRTLRIAKTHIQIQKCASFNNKLHNFNLLTHKGATTTQSTETQWKRNSGR